MVPPPCTTEGRAVIISFDMAAGRLSPGSDRPFCTMHLDYGLESGFSLITPSYWSVSITTIRLPEKKQSI